jgi:hypothetical protein
LAPKAISPRLWSVGTAGAAAVAVAADVTVGAVVGTVVGTGLAGAAVGTDVGAGLGGTVVGATVGTALGGRAVAAGPQADTIRLAAAAMPSNLNMLNWYFIGSLLRNKGRRRRQYRNPSHDIGKLHS